MLRNHTCFPESGPSKQAYSALVTLLAPFGLCTERGALPSRSAGSVHDTATSDLPTLLASWRRHLTAQRRSQATLAPTPHRSGAWIDSWASRRCDRSRRGSSENTSRRSSPTCSSGGSLPPRITDIAPCGPSSGGWSRRASRGAQPPEPSLRGRQGGELRHPAERAPSAKSTASRDPNACPAARARPNAADSIAPMRVATVRS